MSIYLCFNITAISLDLALSALNSKIYKHTF